MHTKQIQWFGAQMLLACDGNCAKAWGINSRPSVKFDPKDSDDYAFLADDELGEAPADPGIYEFGQGKPDGPHAMNKWCSRECERASMLKEGQPVTVRDFSQRRYNQPWKHKTSTENGPAPRV